MNQISQFNNEDINDLRKQLDLLDTELIEVLARRMALIPMVAEYKKKNNVARYQPEREKEVIKDRRQLAEKLTLNPDLVEDMIKRIIEDAHRIESEIMGE
ncbi:MAG: chorismate mutase [Patescibacteria group bacterium]